VGKRLGRYHKVAALAERPTLPRRMLAGLVAGLLAFLLLELIFGLAVGTDPGALFFASVGFAIAAAVAAATLRPGLAVIFGVLGAIWLLFEFLLAAVAILAGGLG
jgi:hypothetical protein